MKKRAPAAPKHLTAAARKWWRTVTTEFELESHHLHLLQAAAELWDRSQQARTVVAKEGPLTVDRFGQSREHPAAKLERDSKIAFARILRELALDVAAPETPRPPQLNEFGKGR